MTEQRAVELLLFMLAEEAKKKQRRDTWIGLLILVVCFLATMAVIGGSVYLAVYFSQ